MLDACFEKAGKTYGIDPGLLRSIAKVESSMKPSAIGVNKDGSVDIGIMQINSRWVETFKIDKRWLLEPCYNIHFGAMVLKLCLDRFKDLTLAIDCYNKGHRASYDSEYVKKVLSSYWASPEVKASSKDLKKGFGREPIAVIFGRF